MVEKPSQLPAVARTEVSYLDLQGRPVEPEKAVRVITREYDEEDNLINTNMTLNPRTTF